MKIKFSKKGIARTKKGITLAVTNPDFWGKTVTLSNFK